MIFQSHRNNITKEINNIIDHAQFYERKLKFINDICDTNIKFSILFKDNQAINTMSKKELCVKAEYYQKEFEKINEIVKNDWSMDIND